MRKIWIVAAVMFFAVRGMAGEGLEADFRTLPLEARRQMGPLFWLHGDESAAELTGELTKVLEAGNGTFTAESRPHNDWLGEGWYRDLGVCLDFARRHNLTMWIFDEKWWPSGEVAGKVPPQYTCRDLVATSARVSGPGRADLPSPDHLVAILAGRIAGVGNEIDGASLIDLTGRARDGRLSWSAPAGEWQIMTFTWQTSPRRRGHLVVNGLSREAVDWYLATVYQPHYDRFKEDFGSTIQGYFYDEPETLGDFGPELIPMLKGRGVDWMKALVAYKFRLAGEEQLSARYQYQDAKAEAWGRTLYGGISSWCRAHGVASIGHFLEHNGEYLKDDLCAGNMFQLMKYTDMGGMDLVFKQLPPGTRPRGTYQMAKLASSISHVYGKKDDLAMVEIFGARGQDLTYAEMKWQADAMQVRGVNFLIPHSFNPRAPYDRDCPPYFYNGGREPRYPLYRVFADYSSRLSLLLTGGRHVAPAALLFAGNSSRVGKAVRPEELTSALQDALFDMDWMPYDVLENDARIEGRELTLFGESYRVLVVPPVEVIPYATLARAKEFFEAGGVVVGYGFLPTKSATLGRTGLEIRALTREIWGTEPQPDTRAKKVSAAGGRAYFLVEQPSAAELTRALKEDAGVRPDLEVIEGVTDNWVHVLHRVKDGRDVFLVANQNLGGGARKLKLRVRAAGEPECWDALRNELTSIDYSRRAADEVEVSLWLEPYESALLVFNPERRVLPLRLAPDARPEREIAARREADPAPLDPAARNGLWERIRLWMSAGGRVTLSPVEARPFFGRVTLPAEVDLARSRVYVLCEGITPEAAARVTVNGQYAGGFIERPLRLEVTALVRPGENELRIEPFAPASVKLGVFPR